ncbi:hypothetical protein NA57DRAFT_26386 [Neofusicoccum parvum]|uniref:Uncharacterized protein n=1 Tax=Neofusicoccum parvum TaxID=310453 RepID=A0ACB5SQJ5_9PEZI|nr:hypothetical protein NA57DRAFT_26386 [Neofusicoccum parvum]
MLSTSKKSVSIRLEDPNVVFRGNHRDGEPYNFGGSVQLTADTPTTVIDVRITLQAFRKVSWPTNTLQASWVRQKDLVFCKELQLLPPGSEGGVDCNYGHECHSWPFNFALDATMPETVDSLPFSYIHYYMIAEVRTGRWRKPLRTVQGVRVTKAPSSWAEDTCFPEQSADIWPNKISYRISLPRVHHTLARQMAVDFLLIPLKDGLSIGHIELDLIETTFLVATKEGQLWRADKSTKVIASTVASIPSQCKGEAESLQGLETPEESQKFSIKLDLPQGLNLRFRSIEDEKIKVGYVLKVSVDLVNPDGHVSKVGSPFPY